MNTFTKYWIWILIFFIGSIAFINWAQADEKNVADGGNLEKLFSNLGIKMGGESGLNPCIELEENARRYCTPSALNILLNEKTFGPIEDKLIREFLSGPAPCEQTANYIGRVCEIRNFAKIIKHFSLKE